MMYNDAITMGTLEEVEAFLETLYEAYEQVEWDEVEAFAHDIKKLEARRVELKLKAIDESLIEQ